MATEYDADREFSVNDAEREFLTNYPVREYHVPNWLRKAIFKAVPRIGMDTGSFSGLNVLWTLKSRLHAMWLDRFGGRNRGRNRDAPSCFRRQY